MVAAACEKIMGKKHRSKKSHGNSSVFLAGGLRDSRRFIFFFKFFVFSSTHWKRKYLDLQKYHVAITVHCRYFKFALRL